MRCEITGSRQRQPMPREKLFSVTIKDCKVSTFTVGGHGGAGKDTSNTGVCVIHPASGAMGIGQDHRSQLRNKQDAFRRMAESTKFHVWLRRIVAEMQSGKTLDEIVEDAMHPSNLKVEYRTEKGWQEIDVERE